MKTLCLLYLSLAPETVTMHATSTPAMPQSIYENSMLIACVFIPVQVSCYKRTSMSQCMYDNSRVSSACSAACIAVQAQHQLPSAQYVVS